MKTFAAVVLLCLPTILYGQQPGTVLTDFAAYPVRTISPADDDYSDLSFLKDVLRNKRIVLLGEQTHGDGATFEAKIRLIKFLHQELGFSMLSFESGLYDNYYAFQQVKPGGQDASPLIESIFGIWSDTKEFKSLIEYVHMQRETKSPLVVSGFDCQEHAYFEENFLTDLKAARIALSEKDLELLEQVISVGPEFIATAAEDSAAFFSMVTRIKQSMQVLVNTQPSEHHRILQQVFDSWLAMIEWQIDEIHEREILVQNPRDLQMAKNLIFLANLYPDKKIIAWGASYHFANELERLEYSAETKKFVHRMDSLARNPEPTDIQKSLQGAIPMGKIVKQHFGDQLYSISFSSYEGSYGLIYENVMSLELFQPPAGSLEKALVDAKFENAFVDYPKTSQQKFYTSSLGNLPVLASWQQIFDGHFFIKKSYPPSLPVLTGADSLRQTAPNPVTRHINSQSKMLVDAQTGEGIAFASIALANSSKGVTSNALGEFAFHAPGSVLNDYVIISCIGYETKKITINELDKLNQIKLTPQPYLLDEVEIKAKGLSARDIIKRAEKHIKKNYYQSANQQELFYRSNEFVNDSLMFSEEAAVLVHDPDGYRTSGSASKNLKGQILQFRNTTPKSPHNSIWDGVGHIWLTYSHDVVLSKSNVLHRSVFYSLMLKGVTAYNNKRVYEIDFDCKRPGAYTTGYGYSAPESATGKIFIDASTFAVLRYEMLVKRKPHTSKRNPHLTYGPYGHKLIQTYEEFEGEYFLKYSKQIMYGNTKNSKNNTETHGINIHELVATEVKTNPSTVPAIPIIRIKTVPVPYNPDFWKSHNTVFEDDVKVLYNEFGMINDK
jgi:erythromycin esterase-like protein